MVYAGDSERTQEDTMKKFFAVIAFLAMAGAAFGLGNRQSMTEEEALALIDQKVVELKLQLQDGEAAQEAFKAMVQAGARVQEALKIVNKALEDGLRVREMNEIALRMRAMIGQGLSAGKCEDAAQDMVRLMIRDRLRLEDGEGDGTQTRTQESTGPGPVGGVTPAPAGKP